MNEVIFGEPEPVMMNPKALSPASVGQLCGENIESLGRTGGTRRGGVWGPVKLERVGVQIPLPPARSGVQRWGIFLVFFHVNASAKKLALQNGHLGDASTDD